MNPRPRRPRSLAAAPAVLAAIVAFGALVALGALAACPANNTPQAMPPSPPPGSGYEPPDNTLPPDATDAAPAAAPLTDAADVAQACLAASDCPSGVCEGLGCGPDAPGVCQPKVRRCTRDRRPYCGCDGNTFYSSGTCPGKRYSSQDMCPDGR